MRRVVRARISIKTQQFCTIAILVVLNGRATRKKVPAQAAIMNSQKAQIEIFQL
jgi:hypothetical protein